MFVFGHVGIGAFVARRLVPPRELRWVALGALLPDAIDKPLYYGLALATGKRAAELGLISGTRTVGHTVLLALLVWLLFRRHHGAVIAFGMGTHLVLDLIGDFASMFEHGPPHAGPGTWSAVLFPLLGPHFPVSPYRDMTEHALFAINAYILAGELIGFALLMWMWTRGQLSDALPWGRAASDRRS